MNTSILIVDDDAAGRYLLFRHLKNARHEVQEAASLAEARLCVAKHRFDMVLLDLNLPDGSGLDWLSELRLELPSVAVVIITAFGDIPMAVEAMRRGAENFLTKPIDLNALEIFIARGMETNFTRRRDLAHRRQILTHEFFFGNAPLMERVNDLGKLAADGSATVLLQGETGTGKGLFARWLHENGSRSAMPLVEVNCSVLRGELLATELFGHTRGAFTSAVEGKEGLLDLADGGTLFLDEIADMDFGVQSQMLKAIEEKRFRPLGELRERRSDFRLICATNKNLLMEVEEGRFRKDLYYRIRVLPIDLPPLRDRIRDIHGLCKRLLSSMGHIGVELLPSASALLKKYPWPGNVRELRNVLERAVLLSRGQPLDVVHFPGLDPSVPITDTGLQPDVSKEADLEKVLLHFGGDKTQTARHLGISRATLYRKLKNLK